MCEETKPTLPFGLCADCAQHLISRSQHDYDNDAAFRDLFGAAGSITATIEYDAESGQFSVTNDHAEAYGHTLHGAIVDYLQTKKETR